MSQNSTEKKSITSTSSEGQDIPISPVTGTEKVGRKSGNGKLRNKKKSCLTPRGGKITSTSSEQIHCPMCDKGIHHMVVILREDGHTHVHAPFDNKFLMNEFINSITREVKRHEEEK